MIKNFILNGNLVLQIAIGLIVGILLAIFFPSYALSVKVLGELFLTALKSAAPVLVFVLVMSAIANHKAGQKTSMKSVITLYLLGTFLAALSAVVVSYLFPTDLTILKQKSLALPSGDTAPTSIVEVLRGLLLNFVDNPVNALIKANFIGILAWAIGLGMAMRHASESSKNFITDLSDGVTYIVRIIIRFAPLGIFGLVASTIAETGVEVLKDYVQLLAVLLGTMLFVALVVNPAIVYWKIRSNPYPLVFTCLRESGVTAFFTRSSAANVPVNMELSKKLGLNEDTYSISIPLGATINMAGAAVTISVLTLAAVHTLGIKVDIFTALLLSVVSALCACGASGVAGGSLLLIPLACSLFDIHPDIAWTVVGVGMTIGVIQDSAETALNSSTDVLFTAATCIADEKK